MACVRPVFVELCWQILDNQLAKKASSAGMPGYVAAPPSQATAVLEADAALERPCFSSFRRCAYCLAVKLFVCPEAVRLLLLLRRGGAVVEEDEEEKPCFASKAFCRSSRLTRGGIAVLV